MGNRVSGLAEARDFPSNGSIWSWQGQLLAADGAPNDFFGTFVGVFGDTAVVGSFFDNTAAGTDAGSAYVCTRSGGVWTQTQQLFASDAAANDSFGAGVAISGGCIVVGAYADDTPAGLNAGSAYCSFPSIRLTDRLSLSKTELGSRLTQAVPFSFPDPAQSAR